MSDLEHASTATDRPEQADGEQATPEQAEQGRPEGGNTESPEVEVHTDGGDVNVGTPVETTTPEPDVQTDNDQDES